jgi:hypothetical protein
MQLNQFSWLDPHVLLVALYIVPTGGQSIHFISCQSSTLRVYIHSILFHLMIMQSTTSVKHAGLLLSIFLKYIEGIGWWKGRPTPFPDVYCV